MNRTKLFCLKMHRCNTLASMSEQEYINTVCANIKEQRIKRGLTQFEFATLLNVDDSSIRRIEAGRTSPTLKTLYRLAKALDMNLIDLLPPTI